MAGSFDGMSKDELLAKAREMGISGVSEMRKEELIQALEQVQSSEGGKRKRK